jgi:hypothetical protein
MKLSILISLSIILLSVKNLKAYGRYNNPNTWSIVVPKLSLSNNQFFRPWPVRNQNQVNFKQSFLLSSNQFQSDFGQCDGQGFMGLSKCRSGLQCVKRSRWYSQCRVGCPIGLGWDCETELMTLNRQSPIFMNKLFPKLTWTTTQPPTQTTSQTSNNRTSLIPIINSFSSSVSLISQTEFIYALLLNNFPAPRQDQYTNFLNFLRLSSDKIQSKREAAMFLAHVIHETSGLRFLREQACIQTGCTGQYISRMGRLNRSYYGRGYIQLVFKFYFLIVKFSA